MEIGAAVNGENRSGDWRSSSRCHRSDCWLYNKKVKISMSRTCHFIHVVAVRLFSGEGMIQ